jgi:hypothetical protein
MRPTLRTRTAPALGTAMLFVRENWLQRTSIISNGCDVFLDVMEPPLQIEGAALLAQIAKEF